MTTATATSTTNPTTAALATLAEAWKASAEERDRQYDAMCEALKGRREARGAAHTPDDDHNDAIELQGPFEEADDREWDAHEAFRHALQAIGTGAAIVGDDLYAVGPEGDKERGGEIHRIPLADIFRD